MGISESIKDALKDIRDIKTSKDYKEGPIPWKRLLIAIAVSACFSLLIVASALSIAADSDIPEESHDELAWKIRLIDGMEWQCSSSDRKALREKGIQSDGFLQTKAISDGLGEIRLSSPVLPVTLPMAPIDGYLQCRFGRTDILIYIDDELSLLMLSFQNGESFVFEAL